VLDSLEERIALQKRGSVLDEVLRTSGCPQPGKWENGIPRRRPMYPRAGTALAHNARSVIVRPPSSKDAREGMPLLHQVRTALRIIGRKAAAARLQRAHARHRAAHPALYAGNDAILARYRAGGGLSHVYQDYKLASLRALLQERRPRHILELGSGSTTAIFAEYVHATPGARLVSVDESEAYLKEAQSIAGIAEGDPRFRLECRERILVRDEAGQVVARRYAGSFADDYDLVFVDGPSGTDEQGVRHKLAPSADVVDIVLRQAPRTIVVDGKYATVELLQQRFGGLYDAYPSDLSGGTVRPGYRYLSYFHLRS